MSNILEMLAKAGAPKIAPVEIEGQTFYVRGMASLQRAVFLQCTHQAVMENSAVPDHTIVALGLCKEDGSKVSEDSEEVLRAIEGLDGAELYKLAAKILELSGFTKKAVEDAAKN